jgi:ornithine cyclodeaminase/alanine dehydrogenase
MIVLTEQDLASLLQMRDVIDAVGEGFKSLARGEAFAPERVVLDISEHDAVMFNMPARARETEFASGALGTKVVSVFPHNRDREIEVVQSVYLLLDCQTGAPQALMEGRYITGVRTAATSAVATRLMACRGPKRLSIFGAGVQARFHARAMVEVADIESVLISSRDMRKAERLAEEIRSTYGLACESASPDRAAAEADLICTCTTSSEPLFDGSLISPGAHINAVGAYTPHARELDTTTVRRSRLIIDSDSAAGREAGDVLIPLSERAITQGHILGTLSDVVSGHVEARRSPDDITLFKSCGLAIEDLVTARLAYDLALERGAGVRVEI